MAFGAECVGDGGGGDALVLELEHAGDGAGRVVAAGGGRGGWCRGAGVEPVEVDRGEFLEADGADVGDDVEADLLFVAAPGGGFEVGAAGGEPFVEQVVGDGDLGRG